MVDRNNLVCYEENNIKKWEMIKDKDRDVFLLNLLINEAVDNHTIFIIPECSILSGIWLQHQSHKSNRVDFFHFHEDYGVPYERPEPVNSTVANTVEEVEDRRGPSTKYGWISPDGRYFHCNFQEHSSLADRICFGTIETNNPEHYLEEHGWCKIFKPLVRDKYTVYVGGDHVITDAQMKTLIELGLDNAHGLSDMLCKNE